MSIYSDVPLFSYHRYFDGNAVLNLRDRLSAPPDGLRNHWSCDEGEGIVHIIVSRKNTMHTQCQTLRKLSLTFFQLYKCINR